MATTTATEPINNKEYDSTATHDHINNGATNGAQRGYGNYGGNPLARKLSISSNPHQFLFPKKEKCSQSYHRTSLLSAPQIFYIPPEVD